MLNKKKVLLILFFAYVLIVQVFPPVFINSLTISGNSEESLNVFPNFNVPEILFFVVWCIVFYIICWQYNFPKPKVNKKSCLGKSFAAFCAIIAIYAVISSFAKNNFCAAPSKTNAQWIVFFLGVFCAAAFEESLYRFYLPQSLLFFIQNTKLQSTNTTFAKILQFTAEVLCVLLFGLAHKYLGIFAILNAIADGIILRLLAKRTNIICCWLVHSIYNCTIFAFFILS